MNKFGACFASLLMLVALTACGNKESPATTSAPAASSAPVATPGETPPAASEPPEATGTAEASAAPAETISETDDGGQESVAEAAPSTTQPSLRLGGPAATAPTSSRFKEGANYAKVVPAQPTSVAPGKVEVVEVFWYGCGHCFALDPALEVWRGKTKPAYVDFVRIPAMWNDTTRLHARVFFTAELLGKLEELHTPIFREINVKGDQLNTVEKITAFFRTHGVSADEFQKAFSSFAVENKLQRADFLNRRYRIESVPTLIVNGKYRTDLGMAGGEPQLFDLINELAASEHGG